MDPQLLCLSVVRQPDGSVPGVIRTWRIREGRWVTEINQCGGRDGANYPTQSQAQAQAEHESVKAEVQADYPDAVITDLPGRYFWKGGPTWVQAPQPRDGATK